MAGFTVQAMLDMLGLRLEDSSEDKFGGSLKLTALNWAQLEITSLIHMAYLTELEEKDFDITCAVEAADGTDDESSIAYSELNKQPLANGIQRVKINGGAWAHMMEADGVRKSVNTWDRGTNKRPLAYVQRERIYLAADNDTQHIDVHYLREPESMVAQFTVASVAGGAVVETPDLDAYYIVLTFTAPGWSADEFIGQCGYNETKESNFLVIDNTTTALSILTTPEEEIYQASDVIHFITADGTLDSLENAACELNPRLHNIVVDLAEAHLWRHDHKMDRSEAAYAKAVAVINALNERYGSEAPIGIGTGRN